MSKQILEYETIVLNIIREYLNQNRFFTLEKIIPYINVRLKKYSIQLNYEGIKRILESLIKKKQILERSKLTKQTLLENENRKKIYDYICNHPGVYFNQIARKLYISNYILAWHIKMLLKFGYIRSKIIENHEVFFDKNLNHEYDEIYFLLSKKKSKEIINFLIKQENGATKTAISRVLKMHTNTVSKYIKKLENNGILKKIEQKDRTFYHLNYSLYRKIIENK
ncbi:MAG: winged helix-turn-helix transcriptional regulator [Promethearchaeota archaeon]